MGNVISESENLQNQRNAHISSSITCEQYWKDDFNSAKSYYEFFIFSHQNVAKDTLIETFNVCIDFLNHSIESKKRIEKSYNLEVDSILGIIRIDNAISYFNPPMIDATKRQQKINNFNFIKNNDLNVITEITNQEISIIIDSLNIKSNYLNNIVENESISFNVLVNTSVDPITNESNELNESKNLTSHIEYVKPPIIKLGFCIYVLLLENGMRYIGKTTNLLKRLEWHKAGNSTSWTTKYKFLKLERAIYDNVTDFDEDKYTLLYMAKYGINTVRGGQYTRTELHDEELTAIKKAISSASNLCYKCGSPDHFANRCESYNSIKEKNFSVNVLCFKCKKYGHYANRCESNKLLANAGKKWSQQDELKLKKDYENGKSIVILANEMGRTEIAIMARLKKLNLLEI